MQCSAFGFDILVEKVTLKSIIILFPVVLDKNTFLYLMRIRGTSRIQIHDITTIAGNFGSTGLMSFEQNNQRLILTVLKIVNCSFEEGK